MSLIDIFQANSDKARLITTIIGVIIALSVVGLNQLFNSRRAKKETYISKIEKLYEALIKSKRLLTETHNTIVFEYGIENTGEKFDQLHLDFFEAIETVRLISDLYFHGINLNLNEMERCYLSMMDGFTGADALKEYLSDYSKEKDHVASVYADAKRKVQGLMNEYMH